MKTLCLFCILFFSTLQSYTQVCDFTYTQTSNIDTFFLPTLNSNYVVDSIKWDFGDGIDTLEYAGSITTNMPHSYLYSGNYFVCLSVWLTEIGNPTPVLCSSCDTIHIQCLVNFIADTSGNTITANEINSVLPGPIISYSWNYGDGTPQDTTDSIYHAYDTVGVYNLCLTIHGITLLGTPYQCTSCADIQITKSCHLKLNFSYYKNGNRLTINPSYQGLVTCDSMFIERDFGDGTGIDTFWTHLNGHIYASYGTYNVCLYSTGSVLGGSIVRDTFCIPITIQNECYVEARWGYKPLDGGLSVKFTDSSIQGLNCSIGTGNRFEFGDGGIGFTTSINTSSQNPYATHTYLNPGVYTVCQIVEGHKMGQGSAYDTLCKDIFVDYCKPKAEFSYSSSELNINLEDLTVYSGQCLNSDSNYFDFGDHSISNKTLPNSINNIVSHQYKYPGVYDVCLISEANNSTNRKGYDTLCKSILIESSSTNNTSILSIYPNPVNGILSVVFPRNEIGLPQHFLVSDITGRIISNQQYVPDLNGEIQIDFTQYTRGVYFVFNHIANQSRKQFKVIKE